jgi:uncharacterized protein
MSKRFSDRLGEGARGRRPLYRFLFSVFGFRLIKGKLSIGYMLNLLHLKREMVLPPPPNLHPQPLKGLDLVFPGPIVGGWQGNLRTGAINCAPTTASVGEKTENRPYPPALPATILLFLLLALALSLGGCGKKATPFAPDEVLPAPVREFRLSQEGEGLVSSWLLPKVNILGQPLTQVVGCRVYRAEVKGVAPEAPGSLDFIMYAEIDLAYPRQGEVRGEAMMFRDRELSPGRRYYYRVAAYDQGGRPGGWSKTLSHAWGALPRAVRELKAKPGDKAVQLTWTPVAKLQDGSPVRDLAGYSIYRRSGSGPWLLLNPGPLTATVHEDLAVLNDVEYTYKVQAVRRLGGDLLASLDSPTGTAMPEKRTPPPPVLNLFAVATSQGVELRWEPSPVPDLAGYRLYRRAAGEEKYTPLTPELLKKPFFVDTQVQRGQSYHYYVTAVDHSPRANEGLPSEAAAVTY